MSRILPILLIASLAVAVSSSGLFSILPLVVSQLMSFANGILAITFTVPAGLSSCVAAEVAQLFAAVTAMANAIVAQISTLSLSGIPAFLNSQVASLNSAISGVANTTNCVMTVAEQDLIAPIIAMVQGYVTFLMAIIAMVTSFLG